VISVLKSLGRDVTRERFVAAMDKLQNFDTGIIAGPLSFTPTDHAGAHDLYAVGYDSSGVLTADVTAVRENTTDHGGDDAQSVRTYQSHHRSPHGLTRRKDDTVAKRNPPGRGRPSNPTSYRAPTASDGAHSHPIPAA
jgi:hypothetical protein